MSLLAKLKRSVLLLAKSIGVFLTALLALLALALGYLLTLGEHHVVDVVNGFVADSFQGKLVIERVEDLGLYGAEGVDAHLLDPSGRRVAEIQNASAGIDLPGLVSDLLFASGPLQVEIEQPNIEHLRLEFRPSEPGPPSFTQAFQPVEPSQNQQGQSVAVTIDDARIEHAWLHGKLGPNAGLDIEIELLRFGLEFEESSIGIELDELGARVRRLAGAAVWGPIDVQASGGSKLRLEPANDWRQLIEALRLNAEATASQVQLKLDVGKQGPKTNVNAALVGLQARHWQELGLPWAGDVGGTTSLSLQASGQLPELKLELAVDLPPTPSPQGESTAPIDGRLLSSGTLQLASRVSYQGELKLRQIDPGLWVEGLGMAPVDATFNTSLTAPAAEAPFEAEVEGVVEALSVQGNGVPALNVQASLDAAGLTASVAERRGNGLRVDLDAPDLLGAGQRLNFQGHVTARIAQGFLPADVSVQRGQVEFSGTYDLDTKDLELSVTGILDSLTVADQLQASGLTIDGQATGRAPHFQAHVTAERLEAAGRRFRRTQVRVSGTPQRIDYSVDAQGRPSVKLSGTFSPQQGLATDNIDLTLGSRDDQVHVQASALRIDGSRVTFDDLELQGAGRMKLSGQVSPRRVRLDGWARGLRVHRLAELAGVSLAGAEAKVDFDTDLSMTRRRASGRLRVEATDIVVPSPYEDVQSWSASFDVLGNEQQLRTVLSLEADGSTKGDRSSALEADSLHVTTLSSLEPVQRFDRVDGWREGLLELELRGGLDLGTLSSRLPDATPYEARGALSLRLRAERKELGADPEVFFRARTDGLRVMKQSPDGALDQIPELQSLDLRARGRHLPEDETTRLGVLIVERDSPLLWARARLPGSLEDWRQAGLREHLEAEPFELRAGVPPRSLESIPGLAGVTNLRGQAKAKARFSGTLAEPNLEANVEFQDLSQPAVGTAELDGSIELDYDAKVIELQARAGVDNKQRLSAQISAAAPWSKLSAGELPADLEADVQLDEFPLRALPPAASAGLEGQVSGAIEAHNLGSTQPKLNVQLELSSAEIRGVSLDGSQAEVYLKQGRLTAFAETRQEEWGAEMRVESTLSFEDPYAPQVQDVSTARARLNDFPLSALSPLLGSSVSGLGGQLDADVQAELIGDEPRITGTAELRKGRLQIPELGQRFSEIRADVVWKEDGTLLVQEGSLKGATGRADFSAAGVMDGVSPKQFEATLDVDRERALPLSVQGVGLGEFWGHIELSSAFHHDQKELHAEVDVSTLQIRFPRIPNPTVINLAKAENIEAGVYSGDEFVELPLQPIAEKGGGGDPWLVQVKIDLGDEVWIHQGPNRRVQLLGALTVKAEQELRVSGEIRLERGRFEINGRMFEVEEGTITFQPEEPGNPIVLATAAWESPQDIRVIAKFVGPVQSGELMLSSEPPLPQGQILSLLLFGSTQGLNGVSPGSEDSGSDSGAARGIAVGGGLATRGLNQALTRVDAVDISTRVRGDQSGNVRPEVVVQLTNSLSAQVSYKLLEPRPGTNPDRTLLTLELRVVGGHSVSSTVGDQGSAVFEWHWRYRY